MNPDPQAVAKVFCCCRRIWLTAIISCGCFAVGRRVESIRNEIEKNTRDLLWEQVDLAGVRIKRFLERDIESLLARVP
jgi:hypothetical protein